jgi:hypothetical protein
MMIELTVQVQVERVQGKFLSRDAIAEDLIEAINGANPDSIAIDESEYEVTDWVAEQA